MLLTVVVARLCLRFCVTCLGGGHLCCDTNRFGVALPPLCNRNKVCTSQYTAKNFIPKNLWMQFHRSINLYFLAIAVLQVIPTVSITHSVPTILLPLLFVVSLTAAKDWVEDGRRKRADVAQNERPVLVFSYTTCQFEECRWSDVKVGMIVKYRNRELIAADTILLQTSDPNGLAYVMTASLDGESALKARQTPIDNLFDRSNMARRLRNMACNIACDLPNSKLHSFKGTLLVNSRRYGPRRIPLITRNIVLRGSQLRNTEWVVGLVVYTGMETKMLMNNRKPRCVAVVMLFVVCCCCLLVFAVCVVPVCLPVAVCVGCACDGGP